MSCGLARTIEECLTESIPLTARLSVDGDLIIVRILLNLLPPVQDLMLELGAAESGLENAVQTPVEDNAVTGLDLRGGLGHHLRCQEVDGSDLVSLSVCVEQSPGSAMASWRLASLPIIHYGLRTESIRHPLDGRHVLIIGQIRESHGDRSSTGQTGQAAVGKERKRKASYA